MSDYPKCFAQVRRIKCSICSTASYLFNSESNNVVVCDNFCVDLVKTCQDEKALFNDFTPVFPGDVTPEVLCGPQKNQSTESMVAIKDTLNGYFESLSIFFSAFNSEKIVSTTGQPQIIIDGSLYLISTNCMNNLNKLQHCYPGTSSAVDSAFMSSIFVYVWVIGLVVSGIVTTAIFLMQWKRRSYEQIM